MRIPSPKTLAKYGLTEKDWLRLYRKQGGCCPICSRKMDKTICIDHFHVKGWLKMPPERRKLYVRGLTDWYCNHYYLGKGITIERAKNVVNYLEEFEKRRPNE